jgi:hypothetical protein
MSTEENNRFPFCSQRPVMAGRFLRTAEQMSEP